MSAVDIAAQLANENSNMQPVLSLKYVSKTKIYRNKIKQHHTTNNNESNNNNAQHNITQQINKQGIQARFVFGFTELNFW